MTGLRDRCVNAAGSREHARLRNSPNASCQVNFCTWGGRAGKGGREEWSGGFRSGYARRNRKNEPRSRHSGDDGGRAHTILSNASIAPRKRPFELRRRRASVNQAKGELDVKGAFEGTRRGYDDTRDILERAWIHRSPKITPDISRDG